MALKVGDTIVLNAEETTQYPPEWQGRRMTVTFIATNVKDHPGYDGDAAAGSPLVDCHNPA